MMRQSTKTLSASTLVVLTIALIMSAAPAVVQGEHTGSISNTHNDLWVVVGDATNDRGIVPIPDRVVVQELISFQNVNVDLIRDYGIVFLPEEFTIIGGYPLVVSYNWTYQVNNYTVVLTNNTFAFEKGYTGVTGSTLSLDPGDLGPDDPFAPHPRVNATYEWHVVVVEDDGYNITTVEGGIVTTLVDAPTVIDLAPLDLPPLGQTEHVADEGELLDLSRNATLIRYEGFKDGFYRFRIDGKFFMPGASLSIEVRYLGYTTYDGGVEFEKLLFTQRLVHVHIYTPSSSDLLARVFTSAGDTRTQLSPTESGGKGEPIAFETSSTFEVIVGPLEDEGLSIGAVGRYVLLAVIIGGLLFLALRGGRRRGGPSGDQGKGEDDDDLDEEEVEDDEVDDDMYAIEERINSQHLTIAGLEESKASHLEMIKDLDRQHDEGDLGDDEWEDQRASAKAEAVAVMKDLASEELTLEDLEERLEDLRSGE